jgi:cytochrome c peroxidase
MYDFILNFIKFWDGRIKTFKQQEGRMLENSLEIGPTLTRVVNHR